MSILRGVTKNLTSLRESVASSVSTAEGIIKSVKKDNAAKRKNTANDAKLFRQRRNNILRQEREDQLEASTVTGSLKRTGKVIQKSNKSFLGRIMDFVGTLLIGWAVTTLPRIIGSAEDVMKRGQLFVRNMEEFVKGIGDIITATTVGILEVVGAAANFDFKQMGDSIQTAAQRVQLGFTRMQLSVDRAFQILSRPMSELFAILKRLGAKISFSSHQNSFPCELFPSESKKISEIGVNCSKSSQVLTGILQVLPFLNVAFNENIKVYAIGRIVSKPYVDLTIDTLEKFGCSILETRPGQFCTRALGLQSPESFLVEGDASSASYFFASACIGGGPIKVHGISRDSKQGDIRLLDVLEKIGATVHWRDLCVEICRTGP